MERGGRGGGKKEKDGEGPRMSAGHPTWASEMAAPGSL